jgi:hypothetical protein
VAVVDVHQHLWPDELVAELRARSRAPYLRESVLTTVEGSFPLELELHDLERRLADIDRLGIDTAIVSLQPTLGFEQLADEERSRLTSAYHAGITALVAASDGRLVALGAGEVADGTDGVCVGASRLLDLEALAPLLDELVETGGFLFVHPDAPARTTQRPPWWTAVTDYADGTKAAYLAWIEDRTERWPDLRVVFALLAGGAPFQLERLRARGADTRRFTGANVLLETSSYGRLALDLCLAGCGAHSLVHGSDYPVIDPTPTMGAIRALGKATSDAIFDHTPSALLARSHRSDRSLAAGAA